MSSARRRPHFCSTPPILPISQGKTYVDREANVSDNNGSYQFNPNIIHATNGTVVTFRCSGIPGNPSMTQSSFASPRQPLAGGFDSGFVAARDPFPGFNYTVVNEQNAVWLYCRKTEYTHGPLPFRYACTGSFP
ncbi:hypothetical protein B0H14DRAFT_3507504 [Mycena olivaceomarginata]|nr:hypothetical protein B0H14DRAFT_3507504 [Mycena olivaceomarginata]